MFLRCCIAIFAFRTPERAPVWRTRAAHQRPRTRAVHQSGGRLRKLAPLQSRRPERPRSSRDHHSKPLGAICRSSASTFSAGATLKYHISWIPALPETRGIPDSPDPASSRTPRISGIRISGIRISGIRISGIRISGIRISGIRISGPRHAPAPPTPPTTHPLAGGECFHGLAMPMSWGYPDGVHPPMQNPSKHGMMNGGPDHSFFWGPMSFCRWRQHLPPPI